MTVEIKNRWNGSVIYSGEHSSLKFAVEHCISAKISLDGARLDGASLVGARLDGARLDGARLDGAPFVVKNLDAKILAKIKSGMGLQMSNWHKCETTHCRGGWAIVLAGELGRTLELVVGTATAANLIYAASRPGRPMPDFFASNEDALADLEKCAAEDPIL